MSTFEFTATNGIKFVSRRIDRGMRYGLDNCILHDKDETLIEFYDSRFPHCEYGQFVSRYYLTTLQKHGPECGLDLHGGVGDWKIDAESLQLVLSKLIA